jgi:hypothetical protein
VTEGASTCATSTPGAWLISSAVMAWSASRRSSRAAPARGTPPRWTLSNSAGPGSCTPQPPGREKPDKVGVRGGSGEIGKLTLYSGIGRPGFARTNAGVLSAMSTPRPLAARRDTPEQSPTRSVGPHERETSGSERGCERAAGCPTRMWSDRATHALAAGAPSALRLRLPARPTPGSASRPRSRRRRR